MKKWIWALARILGGVLFKTFRESLEVLTLWAFLLCVVTLEGALEVSELIAAGKMPYQKGKLIVGYVLTAVLCLLLYFFAGYRYPELTAGLVLAWLALFSFIGICTICQWDANSMLKTKVGQRLGVFCKQHAYTIVGCVLGALGVLTGVVLVSSGLFQQIL